MIFFAKPFWKNLFSAYPLVLLIILLVSIALFLKQEFRNDIFSSQFLISIMVSSFLLLVERLSNAYQLTKKYYPLDGFYKCSSYLTEDPTSTNYNDYRYNGSTAKIFYLESNHLRIELSEASGNIWEGDILMQIESFGSIAWWYKKLNGDFNEAMNRNGIKRCTIRKINNGISIYLFPDHEKGFEREILVKQ